MTFTLLNADIGEYTEQDKEKWQVDLQLIPLLDLANISCNAHAGNEASVARALRLCKQHKVLAGAHPSYPDRDNFGRSACDLSEPEILASIDKQLTWLRSRAEQFGIALHHAKAHGRLYHDLCYRLSLLKGLLALASEHGILRLVLPAKINAHKEYRDIIVACKKAGVTPVFEAFADRRYLSSGDLAPRSTTSDQPSGVLAIDTAKSQIESLLSKSTVGTRSGKALLLRFQTLCVHGDSPDAIQIAQFARSYIKNDKVSNRLSK